MSISATEVRCDTDTLWVHLADGRILGVPLAWFPRLRDAPADALADVAISPFGLHWPQLDEDISIPALLAERPPRFAAE